MDGNKPARFLAPKDVTPNTNVGPPYFEKALAIDPDDVKVTSYKESHTKSLERGGRLGIFTSFMSGIIAGADLSGSLAVSRELKVEADQLETRTFEPSDLYLEQTMQLPRNIALVQEKSFMASVYMITGVKNAYGATLSRSRSQDLGGDGRLGTCPQLPGSEVGPAGGYNQRIAESETIHDKSDFVFAFRLKKIHYSRGRGRCTQQSYTKGAAYGWEDTGAQDENGSASTSTEQLAEEDDSAVEVLGMREEFAGQDEFTLNGLEVFDEETGELCIVIPDLEEPSEVDVRLSPANR